MKSKAVSFWFICNLKVVNEMERNKLVVFKLLVPYAPVVLGCGFGVVLKTTEPHRI